jgi:hypothetical protein
MTDVSSYRNNLLRGLYEQSLKDPQATRSISDLQAYLGDKVAPELAQLVVEELEASGLIVLGDGDPVTDRALKLTASGYYEAERLGGSIKTPALARIVKAIKDHQTLSILIAALGVLLAIAYPEFKEWQAKRAAAGQLDDLKAMNDIVRKGELGVEDMGLLSEADSYCRDNPSESEYRGLSCAVSRGERAPTQQEARDFCQRFPSTIHLGGVSCDQFRQ